MHLKTTNLGQAALALTLVAGLAASFAAAVLGYRAALVLPLAYFAALVAWSVGVGIARRELAATLLPLALATMHLCWGVGAMTPKSLRRPKAQAPQPSERAKYEEPLSHEAEGH